MTKEELAESVEKAVEWLQQADGGCVTLKLDDTLAVCVGWQDGFDENDETVIHAKKGKSWGIVCGIKAYNSDSMRTDYDYISAPFDMDNGVYDTTTSVSPKAESHQALVDYQWREYKILSKCKMTKDGEILRYRR